MIIGMTPVKPDGSGRVGRRFGVRNLRGENEAAFGCQPQDPVPFGVIESPRETPARKERIPKPFQSDKTPFRAAFSLIQRLDKILDPFLG